MSAGGVRVVIIKGVLAPLVSGSVCAPSVAVFLEQGHGGWASMPFVLLLVAVGGPEPFA